MRLAATPALDRAFARFAPLVRSTRLKGPRLCQNAVSVQRELLVLKDPQSAPSALKELTPAVLDLQIVVSVPRARSILLKAQCCRVTATRARPPSIRASLAPLSAVSAPTASPPLWVFPNVLRCVLSGSGLRVGCTFPTILACLVLQEPPLCISDPSHALLVPLDRFRTELVKPANGAVLELSVVALALLGAPRVQVARLAICWVLPTAHRACLAHTLHPDKASASNAVLEHLPTNLEQAHARYVLRDIFLPLVPWLAPSAHLAPSRKSPDPSSASRALKEHTPTLKVQCRASSVQLAHTILLLVPDHQMTAKFAPKALSTPWLVWEN